MGYLLLLPLVDIGCPCKFREFIYLALLSAATIWPFNPVNIAPHSIKAKSSIIGHPETGWTMSQTSEYLCSKHKFQQCIYCQSTFLYQMVSLLPAAFVMGSARQESHGIEHVQPISTLVFSGGLLKTQIIIESNHLKTMW